MPSILFRHIVADLTRILVLTTSVLVAVIAFGAAIRPVMQNLLGAEDLLQFVFQASVPMLQFALPFAAAFAGTIVYARLTAENEVLAMSAAGLSYKRILLPAVGLGAILLIAMAVLVDAAATGASLTGVTVMLTVAVLEFRAPSLALKVKLSGPL